jgi:hypothetical protein
LRDIITRMLTEIISLKARISYSCLTGDHS